MNRQKGIFVVTCTSSSTAQNEQREGYFCCDMHWPSSSMNRQKSIFVVICTSSSTAVTDIQVDVMSIKVKINPLR